MKNFTTVNIILGIAILLVGAGAFFIWQDKTARESAEMYLQGAKLEQEQWERQQKKLEDCLAEAELDFDNYKEANSVEVTTPAGDKVRKWNYAELATEGRDNYRKDKEFCLKLYK
jgi:hypothetical protein